MLKKKLLSAILAILLIVQIIPALPVYADDLYSPDVVLIDWSRFTEAYPDDELAQLEKDIINKILKYNLNYAYSNRYSSQGDIKYLRIGKLDSKGNVGGGSNYYVRIAGMMAYGIASAIHLGIYDESVTGVSEDNALEICERLVRSIAYNHRVNKPADWAGWGNGWQSALHTYLGGLAGWMIFDRLDAQDQEYVRKMVEYEANRLNNFAAPYYRNAAGTIISKGDSKAEENAWNSMIVFLACAMMPNHDMYARWYNKGLELSISAYSVPSDVASPNLVNGKPLSEWLNGSNIEEDGTMVNHSMIHPDYSTAITMNWANAVTLTLAGSDTPEGIFHNGDKVFEAFTKVDFPYNPGQQYAPPTNYRAPGGSFYKEGSYEIYYPQGSDWGTAQQLMYGSFDTMVYSYELQGTAVRGGDYWAELHMNRVKDMQARYTDGRLFKDDSECNGFEREEQNMWDALNLALAKWTVLQDEYKVTDELPEIPLPADWVFEGFEKGFGDWGPSNVDFPPSTSETIVRDGKYSLACVGNSGSCGISYTFSEIKTNKIVDIWFYDTISNSGAFIAQADDNITACLIGVRTTTSSSHYMTRGGGTNTYQTTSVARTTGWHKFTWDFTSGTDVKMYIDGTLVRTVTGVAGVSYIQLGDAWSGSTGTAYYDNVAIYDANSIIVTSTNAPAYINNKKVNTEFDQLGLPDQITLNLINSTTELVDISWDAGDYDKTSLAEQEIFGIYDTPDSVTGDDAVSNTISVKVTLIPPEPPTFTSAAQFGCIEGKGGVFTLEAAGPAPITFGLESEPSGVTLADNVITVADTVGVGIYNFDVTATNEDGTTTQSFTLAVSQGFTMVHAWEFDEGKEPFLANPAGSFSKFEWEDGFIVGTITTNTSSDPAEVKVLDRSLDINVRNPNAKGNYIKIRLKNGTSADNAVVNYDARAGSSASWKDQSAKNGIIPNSDYTEYTFDMTGHTGTYGWLNAGSGNVESFSVMPAKVTDALGTFGIDYIRIQTTDETAYRVKATAGVGGAVTEVPAYALENGTIAVSATPTPGYAFAGWTQTGNGTLSDANKSGAVLTMGNSDVTLVAKFVPDLTSVNLIPAVEVNYATALNAVSAQLPAQVTANYGASSTDDFDIDWSADSTPTYDPEIPGDYVFTGTIELPNDGSITNTQGLTASVTVTVKKAVLESITPPGSVNVAYGTAIGNVQLPATVTGVLADSSTVNLSVTWATDSTPAYSATTPGDYVFTGTAALPGYVEYAGSLAVSITVTVLAQDVVDYGITAATVTGATVTVQSTAVEDETVTVTIEVTDSTKELDGISVTGATVGAVIATEISVIDNVYTYNFNMPAEDVAVAVTLKVKPSIVNKTALESAIAAAKLLIKANYTPVTWTALEAALLDAEAVFTNPDTTQAAVDNALTALEAASDGLVQKTVPPSDSKKRPSGGGGSGNAFMGPIKPAEPVFKPLDRTKSLNALTSGSGSLTIRQKNVSTASLALIQEIVKNANGKPTKIIADSMWENLVDVRVSFDPEKATKNITLSGSTRSDKAKIMKARFEKWYKNKIVTVRLDQQGDFGMTVKVAAKANLAGFNTANLFFYSYNEATNKYTRITSPNYSIDANSYLHFHTPLGGTIIISDGPLNRR